MRYCQILPRHWSEGPRDSARPAYRLGYIRRENKNTKINKNVSVAGEIIFGLGGFHFLVAKNNVFAARRFVACVIFDSRHLWRRKLRKGQNRERQKHYFVQQNK